MSTFSKEDFEPLEQIESKEEISRPSLSYWQDAWRRFKKNKQAIVSALVLLFMFLLCSIGPLVWKVDPTESNLDLGYQLPSWSLLGQHALIIDDYKSLKADIPKFIKSETDGEIQDFSIKDDPTNVNVRLSWKQVPGAIAYRIYRNEYEPLNRNTIGLPLGETKFLHYDDGLKLELKDYFYTLVPLNELGETSKYETIKATVELAYTESDAKKKGIDLEVGERLRLQAHPLGTDSLGRDLLARVIQGGQVSLFIGIVAPLIYVLIGILIGGVSGYFGGNVDNWIMRITDFVIALPFLLFMILFKVILGNQPGNSDIGVILLALVILSWTGTARLVRGQILQLREEPYIQAAKMLGGKPLYIIFRHMVPNTMGVILVTLTFAIPSCIFTEAFLSFIGMGVIEPETSWGALCNDGLKAIEIAPHVLIIPAVFISITVLAFNILGDGLRDALDAKMRARD
ncbi:MAG: ABC transporter permease [Lentisphaeraceae bacterium]|nr:ABC transporter permease [Lentisphaeraceae bacterium]